MAAWSAVIVGYKKFLILRLNQQSSQNVGKKFRLEKYKKFFQVFLIWFFGLGVGKFHPKIWEQNYFWKNIRNISRVNFFLYFWAWDWKVRLVVLVLFTQSSIWWALRSFLVHWQFLLHRKFGVDNKENRAEMSIMLHPISAVSNIVKSYRKILWINSMNWFYE